MAEPEYPGTEDQRRAHPVPPQHAHEAPGVGLGFDAWDADTDRNFTEHFRRTLGGDDRPVEEFWPAYRFGFDLGRLTEAAADWSAVEPIVRRKWEQGQPGKWEQYREAARHAFQHARSRRPA